MLDITSSFYELNNAPVRHIRGRVELYNGSTLSHSFNDTDYLKSITIERVGEDSKFFGFGIIQKANIHLLDTTRQFDFTTDNTLDVSFEIGSEYYYCFPTFRVSRVNRDENTNELSITAYDALYEAANYTVNDLGLPQSYTLAELAAACAAKLGLDTNIAADGFDLAYTDGANFEGIETIQEVLNAIAEATQTIYYLDNQNALTFKRLDRDGQPVEAMTKDKYYTLENSNNKRLAAICNATELGDNVEARMEITGTTQYMRDNPLLELREDIPEVLNTALERMGGITINQFECEWRGNFLLEIGDKISLQTKDNNTVISYILDDVISYNGSFSQLTRWHYTDNEQETATNPTTLGEALFQTMARVDKANKEITLLASEVNDTNERMASLTLDTDSIIGVVNSLSSDISTLSNRVEASITAEDVSIQIQSALDNGVEKITTETGYTFDANGLTVSRSDSEMTTTITEDGMTVYRGGMAVLEANNVGVKATNLHANTYLIIGTNSRLEDYGYDRTGCFWIGG